MIREVAPNIYRISVPLPGNPLRELNSYLVKGGERSLLIDTGFRQKACRSALLEGMQAIGVWMEQTDILLTHLHADHTGLVSDIASSESMVYIDANDRDWLMRDTRSLLLMQEDARFVSAGIDAAMLSQVSQTHPGRALASDLDFDRYEPLYEGNSLRVGEYVLEVIRTPGHTPGHICLWLEEQRIMFTGDHVLFDITPNITCWPNMEDALGCYLSSLRRVREYPVVLALPAHRSTGDFHSRVDELIEHHAFRLQECLKVVQGQPGLSAFDIAGRLTWRIRSRDWQSFPTTQKWFAVGECLSHLDLLEKTGRIYHRTEDGVQRYYPV